MINYLCRKIKFIICAPKKKRQQIILTFIERSIYVINLYHSNTLILLSMYKKISGWNSVLSLYRNDNRHGSKMEFEVCLWTSIINRRIILSQKRQLCVLVTFTCYLKWTFVITSKCLVFYILLLMEATFIYSFSSFCANLQQL